MEFQRVLKKAFISEFGNNQKSCPTFGRFWPVKYLNFWPEAAG